jgi:cyclase
MIVPRVIPCLLLKNQGLVKGDRFRNHKYVGDPINAVRIFSEKEADELFFLDITATTRAAPVPISFVERVADEAFMPFAVGGGIRTIDRIRDLLNAGAEKVCINTAAIERPELVRQAAETFGRQSVVVSVGVKRNMFGAVHTYVRCGARRVNVKPTEMAQRMEELGPANCSSTPSTATEPCEVMTSSWSV